MKTILLNLLIILFAQAGSCQNNKKNDFKEKYTNFGACYNDRETIQNIENKNGKIIKINDNIWAIRPDNNTNMRYALCEIPEELKKENLDVIFSGEIKKIAAYERMAATPFHMKELKVVEKK
ncbi:MAG: hypothetical protein HY958_07740 [Bacteroidia bacterium]|nr:hypothetical protein [Bacteroidia bacterium]